VVASQGKPESPSIEQQKQHIRPLRGTHIAGFSLVGTHGLNPGGPVNHISALSLVVANLIVAFVVMSQKWGYYSVILIYWLEALIIGVYNLGRMFVVCWFGNPLGKWVGIKNGLSRLVLSLVLGGFFVVKFGGLALGLGLLVMAIPGFLAQRENTDEITAISHGLEAVGAGVLMAAGILFVSHGVSFALNFLRRGEYKQSNAFVLLFKPYVRMVLVVVVLILGFTATLLIPNFGRTTGFAVAIVLLKLIVDMVSHAFAHRQRTRGT